MKRLLLAALLVVTTAGLVQADDAERLALAREVIKLTKADKMLDGMTAQMRQLAAQSTAMAGENLSPEEKAAAEKLQGEIMDLTMQAAKDMLTKMDAVYAEVYSEAELKAMKTFFESPEGRSMIEKQPQLMQKSMPLIQEMQRTLLPKIQELSTRAQGGTKPAAGPATKK